VWRRGGAGTLLGRAWRRLLQPIGSWNTLVFFARDLSADLPGVPPRLPLEMHVVGAEELGLFRDCLEEAGLDWGEAQARAARGDLCTVVQSEGRLVHVRWLTTQVGFIPELGATLRLQPGEAYVYASLTPPAERGGGVQPAVSALMMQWGRARGYRRHIFYVRGDNPSALAIVDKIGARRMRTVRCLRFARGNGLWVTGLRRDALPRIEFRPEVSVRSLGPLGLWVRGRAG
jgi:hypothetical protein